MTLTLWRSVRRLHTLRAFSGEGAARVPGRYNERGVRAVYLADCPAGCSLEMIATYASPEALGEHVLFEVEVRAPLVDLRSAAMHRRYGVAPKQLVDPRDYAATRAVGTRLLAEGYAGAIVPSATVARAFNAVVFPEVWSGFRVRRETPLALDDRLVRRLAS